MMNWEKHVDTMKPPSSVIILINIFFILLVLFMMSSNFVFLPGIETGAALPELEGAQIVQANKLIVTLSETRTTRRVPLAPRAKSTSTPSMDRPPPTAAVSKTAFCWNSPIPRRLPRTATPAGNSPSP